MNPTVSVCVPTFNSAKYLRECLDSILLQTFTDFELLIVDNHSSDETLSIAKEYAERDRRIRVIVNEQNIGAVLNFNRCIGLARGSWIKFVFSDDFIAPRCLELMLAASKPESGLICLRRNFLSEDGRTSSPKKHSLDYYFPGLTEISASYYCNTFFEKMRYDFGVEPIPNYVGKPTFVMLRRSVFERLGLFNPHLSYHCDFELWIRVAVHWGITYVPETLATVRARKDSLSAFDRSQPHLIYRSKTLSWIIILHDFAFHTVYAPLREAAANCNPSVNLADLYTKRSYGAWMEALGDSTLLKEWDKIASLYPNISHIAKSGHTKFATEYLLSRLKLRLKGDGKKLRVFFKNRLT